MLACCKNKGTLPSGKPIDKNVIRAKEIDIANPFAKIVNAERIICKIPKTLTPVGFPFGIIDKYKLDGL